MELFMVSSTERNVVGKEESDKKNCIYDSINLDQKQNEQY